MSGSAAATTTRTARPLALVPGMFLILGALVLLLVLISAGSGRVALGAGKEAAALEGGLGEQLERLENEAGVRREL